MAMPASDSTCDSTSQPKDCMQALDEADPNNEFNRNFNQSLLGLKALNSQTGHDLDFSEYLSLKMEKKDDDLVILDDTPTILQKNGNDLDLLSMPKKFTINDSIRNSFKDIMTNVKNVKLKPQDNSNDANSLGNLLAQTKSIGLESRNKCNIIKNSNSQNGITEKHLGNNLFENLKDIQGTPENLDKVQNSSSLKTADTHSNPDVIELDDSIEDELLKCNGDSQSQTKNSEDDLDKKEEDKLLQMETDMDLDSKGNTDDLKDENKLLELDNENSNHSVTSVKSNHSITSVKSNQSVKSNHSIKSNHSMKSNHSVKSEASVKSIDSDKSVKSIHSVKSEKSYHSVKSVNSDKSEKSNHSIISETSVHSISSVHNKKQDDISTQSDSSNHSLNSDISEPSNTNHSLNSEISVKSNSSTKSDISIHNGKPEINNSSSKLDIHNESNSHSIKSDSNDQSTCKVVEPESKCDKLTKVDNNLTNDVTKSVSSEKDTESQDGTKEMDILEDPSEDSQDAKSMASSISDDKEEEKMDIDSDEEEKDDAKSSAKTSSDSKDTSDNDQCSIKSESCDSDLKSNNKGSEKCKIEENENDAKSDGSDRKRPAESEDSGSPEPKKSRLDEVIGKLGTQIGIPLDKVKAMEELSDTDASHLDSEVTESKSEETETSSDTDVDEEDDDDDVAEMKTPVKSPKKSRRVSRKELSMLVKAKVMLYLRTYRDETIKDLHRKIDDLQGSNEMWKNKARDLERKMLELTVLQQKHEKRKAKTAALRQISTKSIGVQVDENKVEKSKGIAQQQSQNQTTPNKSGTKTPPRSSAPVVCQSPQGTQVPVMIQSPPAVTRQLIPITSNLTRPTYSVTTQSQIKQALSLPPQKTQILLSPTQKPPEPPIGQYPCNKTVKSLLDTSRQQQQIIVSNSTKAMLFPTSNNPKVGQVPQQFIMVTSTPSMPTKTNMVTAISNAARPSAKIIDLTDEEEKQIVSHVARTPSIPSVVSSIQSQGNIRNLTPQQAMLPQQNIIFNGPAGTRFVSPNQQPLQLVFNSGAQQIRPGSLLTVVTTPTSAGVRPPVISQQPNVGPPQLRAAQLVPLASLPRGTLPGTTMVTGAQQYNMMRTVRPPPPLQSAPSNQNQNQQKLPQPSSQLVHPPPTQKQSHPAPLPVQDPPPIKPGERPLAPKPTLKISRVSQGIVLSWNMTYIAKNHAEIQSYQLFAYQETAAPSTPSLWKKVGDVKALPLPMACTLTQFQEGNRYHFAVRPVDIHGRPGPFSEPSSIHLMPMK